MTEAEWREGSHPGDMVEALRRQGSGRKLRLFACACCRYPEVWRLLADDRRRTVVETVERFADGHATPEEISAAAYAFPGIRGTGHISNPVRINRPNQAARMVLALIGPNAWEVAAQVVQESVALLGRVRCELLHEVFGDPFGGCVVPPTVLKWNDGTVTKIAQGIYEERAFDRLPILHDALLDAGCDDEELLAHCRSAGPHVRGCWAVDLILGKE